MDFQKKYVNHISVTEWEILQFYKERYKLNGIEDIFWKVFYYL